MANSIVNAVVALILCIYSLIRLRLRVLGGTIWNGNVWYQNGIAFAKPKTKPNQKINKTVMPNNIQMPKGGFCRA